MKRIIKMPDGTVCLQETEQRPGVEETPYLLGKHFNFPGQVLQTAEPEYSLYKIACSIHAKVIDTTNDAIVDACVRFAEAAELTDLYLMDKQLVRDALLEKAAKLRAGTDALHWKYRGPYIECPVCGYNCNDEHYLGEGNYCPDCGTRLLGLKKIMEGQK